ncbi:MAG TPA: 3D domain-containing protein [Chthoniobacterales bacterium]|nr:3D domain-containing protein [Chthoniobacterales bacterium]
MKLFHLLPVGLSCLVASCALDDFHNKTAASTKGSSKTVRVRTTAYTHSESGHRRYGRSNAVGSRLGIGGLNSAAADWSRFPLGTKFKVIGQDQLYIVDDYGSALVGKNTIDLYMPTRTMMKGWGSRDVTIELLELGSYKDSLKILRPRCRASYIRRMMAVLQSKI